jgi:hypothetical protein
MSKGGGGGPSEVSQSTSGLPDYAEPYFKDMMARSAYETSTPYVPYGGARLADFDPAQAAMQDRAIGMGSQGNSAAMNNSFQAAALGGRDRFANPYQNVTNQSLNQTAGLRDDMVNNYSAGNTYGGDVRNNIASYMDPYMQQVVDIQKREAGRQADIRGAGIGLDAGSAGSLGGYREAIMQSENERNLRQQMDDIQAQGSSAAFGQAGNLFEADRQARMNAFGMNQQNQQIAAGMDMDAANSRLGLEQARQGIASNLYRDYGNTDARMQAQAGLLSDLSQAEQDQEFARMGAADQAGAARQGLEQQSLNMGYQDFLNQKDWGRQQLADYQSMLYGLPVQPNQTQSNFSQQAGTLEKLIGSGIGGVGLYNAYKG